MKWLLLITLSLYSFIVQSAPMALTNVGEQRERVLLKPLSMKGNLTAEKLKTPEISLSVQTCKDDQHHKVHFLTQNAFKV